MKTITGFLSQLRDKLAKALAADENAPIDPMMRQLNERAARRAAQDADAKTGQ